MPSKFYAMFAAGTSILAGGAAHAQATTAQPSVPVVLPGSAAPSEGLDEIVVTAQKREQNLQDVPIAITALNAAAIANNRITGVANLDGLSPNLTVKDQGDPSAPSITIRGLGCCATLNAVDPKVGIYIDGVYIGRATGGLFDLADIERVEILRGPQGTLFGRNATAGALSLITRAPTGKFGIAQDLSYGNYHAFRSRTTINSPQIGALSLSFTYLHDEAEGYQRNGLGGLAIDFGPATAGRYGVLTAAKRLGARNTDAVRVAARLTPADSLTIDYKFDYTDANATPEPAQAFGFSAGAGGAGIAGIFALQGAFGGQTSLGATRLKDVYNFSTSQHLQVGGHSLTVAWDATDTVSLKSITAYRWYKQDTNAFDLAATGGLRFDGTFLGQPAGVAPFASLLSVRTSKQHQFSQELQLNISTDDIEFVAGGFYFRERSPAYDPLFSFQTFPGNVAQPPALGITESVSKNESKAVFAQLTYSVTPQLDLTGGLRATWDNRFVDITSLQGGTSINVGLGEHTSNFSHVDYTAIASYKPTGDVTIYGKINTGYVSGGIVAGIAFDPETLTSYEIGLKAELLDRKLRTNVNGYYMDYKNLQVQQFLNGSLVYDNAGEATVKGIEAEFQALPVTGLTLAANFGYQKFVYKSYVTGGVDIGKDGLGIARPRDTPKFNTALSGEYALPQMSGGGVPFARIDARYRSKAFANLTPAGVPATDAVARLDAYWIVDGRVGVRTFDMGGVAVSASLFGKNMFNSRKILFANDLSTVVAGSYVRPRTYGIDVSAKF